MKRLFYIFYAVSFLTFCSCSGDIFDNIKEYATEEQVYVGKFDKAEVHVGWNRAEIDLLNAGRISSVDIGKAIKTIVEYDDKVIPYESVPSWLNITGLTEAKLYRIKIYNVDEHGNKSLPVEATVIPYTNGDLENLEMPVPQKLLAPLSVQFNWVNGLATNFYDFYELEYAYTDAQGARQTKISTDDRSLTVMNLREGSAGTVDLRLKVVPKLNDVPILDTLYITTSLDYQLPSKDQYLVARTARKIKQTFLDGTTAKVSWGALTEHLVISELRYETLSGEYKTILVQPSVTEIECLDAKPGVNFETRSGYIAPGAVDTLYRDWERSKYGFLSFPTGTFSVDPLSYRTDVNGVPTADIPQSEYSVPRTITIEGTEEGTYSFSDLFGGFYEPGRGYGADFLAIGIFVYTPDSDAWPITEWTMRYTGWDYPFFSVTMTNYDKSTQILYLDIAWDAYIFKLILHKQ
jgi:hypothetical protein